MSNLRHVKRTRGRASPTTLHPRASLSHLLRNALFGFMGLGMALMLFAHFGGRDTPSADAYRVPLPPSETITASPAATLTLPASAGDASTQANPLLEENTDNEPAGVTSSPAIAPQIAKWHEITLSEGDNLTSIFKRYRLGHFALRQITSLPQCNHLIHFLRPGNSLRLLISDTRVLQKLMYEINEDETLVVEKINGVFTSKIQHRHFHEEIALIKGRVHKKLRTTLKRARISERQWLAFAAIFSDNVNFNRDLRVGDTFEILYKKYRFDDNSIRSGDIIAAKLTTQNKTHTAIYFQPSPQKKGHYYTPRGDSLVKSFLRVPVKYKRISSPFDMNRYHPVLKVKRPHEGVDLAAPRGTPIKAVANGRVIAAGNRGGYGKLVELDHGNGITTRYGHMSRFAKATRVGRSVRKGQIIGYVGSTGLATGPHVHYEYRVRGMPKNPMRVRLPKGNALPAENQTQFAALSNQVLAQFDGLGNVGAGATVIASR